MGKNWAWSDLHLRHDNSRGGIIAMSNRPFTNLDAMQKAFGKAVRETVKGEDTLWDLGDVGWKISKEELSGWLKNLPGKKILIKGNHDNHSNDWYREVGYSEVYDRPVLYRGNIILSHEPVYLGGNQSTFFNIHGHTHQHNASDFRYFNASVENIGYRPFDLDVKICELWGGPLEIAEGYTQDKTWLLAKGSPDDIQANPFELYTLHEARAKAKDQDDVIGYVNRVTHQLIAKEIT